MDKKAFVRALEKMKIYCELDDPDMVAYLKPKARKYGVKKRIDASWISRLQNCTSKTIDFKDLDLYFSMYNCDDPYCKVEANIAFSRQEKLITKIHYQLHYLYALINKLKDEQNPPEKKEIVKAKLLHFGDMENFFHFRPVRREMFCFEDEIYYRICEAKKFMKIYAIDDSSLKEIIGKLDELEESVIGMCYEKRLVKKNDILYKLNRLKEALEEKENLKDKLLYVKEIMGSIEKKTEISSSRNVCKIVEDPGFLTYYSVVLDESFDRAELIEDLYPSFDISQKDEVAYYDRARKKKGMKPVYFIFEKCRCFFKTYIDGKKCLDENSQEYKDAVDEKCKKLKEFIEKQNRYYSSKNRALSKNEKEEKENWVAMHKGIRNWELEQKCKKKRIRKKDDDLMIIRKTFKAEKLGFKRKMFERLDSDVYDS